VHTVATDASQIWLEHSTDHKQVAWSIKIVCAQTRVRVLRSACVLIAHACVCCSSFGGSSPKLVEILYRSPQVVEAI
jgi:hypothetical protein